MKKLTKSEKLFIYTLFIAILTALFFCVIEARLSSVGHSLKRKSVMTGEPAFNIENGMGFFDYLGSHPECGQWFNRGMANFSTVENPAIADAYDYSGFSHIIDIGGGQGGLLAEILKIHPKVSATLFDLPQLVQNPIYLTNSGLDKSRWATIGGDFFQYVPKGGDAYILKRVLHDWSDQKCVSILRCCHQAIGDDKSSCLLVVDAVVPAGNIPHPSKVQDMGLLQTI